MLACFVLCLRRDNCENWEPLWVSETHSRRKHERKGEARLSLVRTRLPHWVEFRCEKFNPVTQSIMEANNISQSSTVNHYEMRAAPWVQGVLFSKLIIMLGKSSILLSILLDKQSLGLLLISYKTMFSTLMCMYSSSSWLKNSSLLIC